MDKEITKRLLRDAGINIGKFLSGRENHLPSFMEVVLKKLGLSFFC